MQVWKNSLKKYKFYKIAGNSFYFYNGLSEVEFNTKEYVIIKDGKNFALSNDNLIVLLSKTTKSLSFLLDGDNSTVVNFNNAKLLYKRKNKTTYCFLVINENNVLYYELPLIDFLKNINFKTFEHCRYNNFSKQAILPFYEKAKQNGDMYAVCLINYLSSTATKEDVDFLNEYDGENRLFVDREVYGVEDITDIKNVKLNRFGSMFGWRISYDLECKIENRYYKMKYFPSNIENVLYANCPQVKIKIRDNLLDKIKGLTGETDENISTRKLMQLGNFLYETKKTLSNEQMQKVFTDFSKVSLQDLQSLPKCWLDKIDDARLYDWLKCSGLQGYKDVYDYVENIIKNRKERAKNEKVNKQN